MAMLKAAEAFIRSLVDHDVDTVFGVISSHTMALFDALYEYRDAIRFIGTRHEHAAAMMADGYARVAGKPGVCLTSTGPGAANSMGGMGEAYFGSSALLNVTSTAEEHLYGRGLGAVHETNDQIGMFASVAQDRYHISSPDQTPHRVQDLCPVRDAPPATHRDRDARRRARPSSADGHLHTDPGGAAVGTG